MGIDTICVRADGKGHYSLSLTEQAVVFRFRYGALPPAASDIIHILPPQRYTVSCALTDRLILSDEPIACQPVPGR